MSRRRRVGLNKFGLALLVRLGQRLERTAIGSEHGARVLLPWPPAADDSDPDRFLHLPWDTFNPGFWRAVSSAGIVAACARESFLSDPPGVETGAVVRARLWRALVVVSFLALPRSDRAGVPVRGCDCVPGSANPGRSQPVRWADAGE